MNNLERFKKALNWEPIDRLMTYDYLDNREILVQHGGFDSSKTYTTNNAGVLIRGELVRQTNESEPH